VIVHGAIELQHDSDHVRLELRVAEIEYSAPLNAVIEIHRPALELGTHDVEHQAVGIGQHEIADFHRATHVHDDVGASG
jgi:hypothetical protein